MNNLLKPTNCIIDCRNPIANVNIRVICIESGTRINNKNGNVLYIWKVADHTGCINLCVWDKIGESIQLGDILFIQNGYTSKHNNSMHLYTSQKGRIFKQDEFCMPFVETPNISEENAIPNVQMRPPPIQ